MHQLMHSPYNPVSYEGDRKDGIITALYSWGNWDELTHQVQSTHKWQKQGSSPEFLSPSWNKIIWGWMPVLAPFFSSSFSRKGQQRWEKPVASAALTCPPAAKPVLPLQLCSLLSGFTFQPKGTVWGHTTDGRKNLHSNAHKAPRNCAPLCPHICRDWRSRLTT